MKTTASIDTDLTATGALTLTLSVMSGDSAAAHTITLPKDDRLHATTIASAHELKDLILTSQLQPYAAGAALRTLESLAHALTGYTVYDVQSAGLCGIAEFGIIEAASKQAALDSVCATQYGFSTEAEMMAEFCEPSELVAREIHVQIIDDMLHVAVDSIKLAAPVSDFSALERVLVIMGLDTEAVFARFSATMPAAH